MTSKDCKSSIVPDIDYFIQQGAPHCDDPVYGLDPNEDNYSSPLTGNEEESPLKCYKLDEEEDIVDDTVYVNGEGKPSKPSSRMLDVQNAVNSLDPQHLNPGVQPGDIEAIGSIILAVLIALVIICTIAYYAFSAYSQPHGAFWAFLKKWALKWPRWWFCPPGAAQ
jgi:hypothetical protein